MQEQEHRGIKNVERVRRMQEKSERQADLPVPQDTPLKVTLFYNRLVTYNLHRKK